MCWVEEGRLEVKQWTTGRGWFDEIPRHLKLLEPSELVDEFELSIIKLRLEMRVGLVEWSFAPSGLPASQINDDNLTSQQIAIAEMRHRDASLRRITD